MINAYTKTTGLCLLTICSLNAMDTNKQGNNGSNDSNYFVEPQATIHTSDYLQHLKYMAADERFEGFYYECNNKSAVHLLVSLKELCTIINPETQTVRTFILREYGPLSVKQYNGFDVAGNSTKQNPLFTYRVKIDAPEKEDILKIALTKTVPQKSPKEYIQTIPWSPLFNKTYHSQKPSLFITKTHNTEIRVEHNKEILMPLTCNIAITYAHNIMYSENMSNEPRK